MTPLFRKTMFVYVGIVIVAFSVLSIAVTAEVRHFIAQQKLAVLNREAQELLPYIEQVNSKNALPSAFHQLVNHDRKVDGTVVNILLVKNEKTLQQKLSNYLITHENIRRVAAVRRVLLGQNIKYIGRFSKQTKDMTLLVGLPIKQNSQVTGALLLHMSFKELQLGGIFRLMFWIALSILFVSIFVVYITTRRVAQPLARMIDGVHSFGEGNLHERLPVNSNDEVGQLAQTFNEMANRLEHLETMRRDLIANVSHELRTPLTSVRGFIQGILDGVIPPEKQLDYLWTAHRELQRLNAILDTMLDLSAIETGHIRLNLQAVVWASVVRNVQERVQVRIQEKGICWQAAFSDPSAMIWGDRDRLVQILFNLLDNAIRHTETGEISILSSVVDGQLHVQVKDTGDGIAADHLPHIWERFYTTRSVSRTGQQSGLGLTITRHLVELMNGRIDVESELGQGTTFTIRFPMMHRN